MIRSANCGFFLGIKARAGNARNSNGRRKCKVGLETDLRTKNNATSVSPARCAFYPLMLMACLTYSAAGEIFSCFVTASELNSG